MVGAGSAATDTAFLELFMVHMCTDGVPQRAVGRGGGGYTRQSSSTYPCVLCLNAHQTEAGTGCIVLKAAPPVPSTH